MTTPAKPAVNPIALEQGQGEALWFFGALAIVKASSETTAGRVTVIEHLALDGGGPPVHVHQGPPFTWSQHPRRGREQSRSEKLLINAIGVLLEIAKSILHCTRVLRRDTDSALHQLRIDTFIGK
jgi:hypothetical protein